MSEHIYVDAGDDLRLHVSLSGEGAPVVLLHGFTGSTTTWDVLTPVLDSHCRTIAIDFPGHGRSSSPADPARYSLDRFGRDITTVLDSLGIDRAVVLGYSMGARAALRFAVAHGDRLSGLILESASPGIAEIPVREARVAADALLAESLERDGIAAFVARWEKLAMWNTQSKLGERARASLREQRLASDPLGLANSLRGAGAGADADILDATTMIGAPTLLIVGELDVKYVQLGRQLAASIAGSELVIVPGSGHAIHLEYPEIFIALITGFLARILPA